MIKTAPCGDQICVDKPPELDQKTANLPLNKKTLEEEIYPERPMYRTEFGRVTWRLLHRTTLLYPVNPSENEKITMNKFIKGLSTHFPCKECADHLKNEIKVLPPNLKSRDEIAKWMCLQHNNVNTRLNKKNYDCDKMSQILKDYQL